MHPLLMLPAIVLGVAEPVIDAAPNARPPAVTAPASAPDEVHWLVPSAVTLPDKGIAGDR